MAKRKRIKVKTVDHEVINMREPHTYLIRRVNMGSVLDQVETSDLNTARKVYGGWFPPCWEGSSPSLRVDGKELQWDSETYIMQADSDRQVPIKSRTEKKPPRQVKQNVSKEPYAMVKNYGTRRTIYMNRLAYDCLHGAVRVRAEVYPDKREIRLTASDNGLKLSHSGAGYEFSSRGTIKGLDIASSVRYPVEQCDGGIMFRYREGYHESAG